jgi:hypothetical protein
MAGTSTDEARIDEQLKDTEKAIAELQKKRAELLRAQGAIRWAKTKTGASPPGVRLQQNQVTNPVPTFASTKALEKTLNSLEWSSFKKKEGEWTFLRKRDGSLMEMLESETDFVNLLRKGKELVVGKYRYVVSDDKFLNRYFEA